MARWLFGDLLIPVGAFGHYVYAPATPEDLVKFVLGGPFKNALQDERAQGYVLKITGCAVSFPKCGPHSFKPGDDAMVIRMGVEPDAWEIATLHRYHRGTNPIRR